MDGEEVGTLERLGHDVHPPTCFIVMSCQSLPVHSLQMLFSEACRGSYCEEFLIVSHRWEKKTHPDDTGEQFDAIREHVKHHPKIKWVWFEYALNASWF